MKIVKITALTLVVLVLVGIGLQSFVDPKKVPVDPVSMGHGRNTGIKIPPTTKRPTGTTVKPLGSIEKPFPMGMTHNVDGWDVKVIAVDTLSVDELTGVSAPPGFVFKEYTINAVRTGMDTSSAVTLNPKLLGSSNVERGAGDQPICLSNNSDSLDTVHKGGMVQFKSCISVPVNESDHLILGLGLFKSTWFETLG